MYCFGREGGKGGAMAQWRLGGLKGVCSECAIAYCYLEGRVQVNLLLMKDLQITERVSQLSRPARAALYATHPPLAPVAEGL
jgi:hypothetical protein